jgi:hypothetical protein
MLDPDSVRMLDPAFQASPAATPRPALLTANRSAQKQLRRSGWNCVQSVRRTSNDGWGGRIRTLEWRNQNPLP